MRKGGLWGGGGDVGRRFIIFIPISLWLSWIEACNFYMGHTGTAVCALPYCRTVTTVWLQLIAFSQLRSGARWFVTSFLHTSEVGRVVTDSTTYTTRMTVSPKQSTLPC